MEYCAGAALPRGSVCASHPAVPGLILSIPEDLSVEDLSVKDLFILEIHSLDAVEIYGQNCTVDQTVDYAEA